MISLKKRKLCLLNGSASTSILCLVFRSLVCKKCTCISNVYRVNNHDHSGCRHKKTQGGEEPPYFLHLHLRLKVHQCRKSELYAQNPKNTFYTFPLSFVFLDKFCIANKTLLKPRLTSVEQLHLFVLLQPAPQKSYPPISPYLRSQSTVSGNCTSRIYHPSTY